MVRFVIVKQKNRLCVEENIVMNVKNKLRISFCFFFSILFINVSYSQNRDSLTLDEIVSKTNDSILNLKNPILYTSFYYDGKIIENGYSISAIYLDSIQKYLPNSNIEISDKRLKQGDSIYFVIEYKGNKFNTQKFNVNKFVHGGELIAGYLSDCKNQLSEFTKDENSFLQQNAENYLYEVLYWIRRKKGDCLSPKCQLVYSVIKTTVSSFININYEFIPN